MAKKLVFGVGLNDADYQVRHRIGDGEKRVWCPYYRTWYNMLQRCYSEAYHKRQPTYIDCKVVDEWLTFSVFKSWMEKQDWKGKQLDKDLITYGNKLYSCHTCIFITGHVNKFISESNDKNGIPNGVHWHGRDRVYSAYSGKRYLGSFKNIESAEKAYWVGKCEDAAVLAKEYGGLISDLLLKRYKGD